MAGETKELTFSEGTAVTAPAEVDFMDLTNDQTAAGEKTFDEAIGMKEVASPANPAAGYKKFFAKTDGKLYTRDENGIEEEVGSGAGAGEINYIENPDAETDTTGWATYDDGAVDTPVDGTGGTASNLTFSRDTTAANIIAGDASFKLAKGDDDAQGEGLSSDFSIDKRDENKLLKIQLPYNTDGAYAAGDLGVWIYDVDNTTLITPSETSITGWDTDDAGSGNLLVSFSSTDSSNYRLIFHVTSTNASAWDFYLDDVVVGPGSIVTGAAIGPWTSYSPAGLTDGGEWGTATGISIEYRRVGDSLEIRGDFTPSTTTASEAQIDLPSGLTVGGVSTGTIEVGRFGRNQASTNALLHHLLATKGDSYLNISRSQDGVAEDYLVPRDAADVGAGTVRATIWAVSIPIAEWEGSGTQYQLNSNMLSANAKVRYYLGTDQTSGTTIQFDTESTVVEKEGVWSISSGAITVPADGTYAVTVGAQRQTSTWSSEGSLRLMKNAGLQSFVATLATGVGTGFGNGSVTCEAGDTIQIDLDSARNLNAGEHLTWIEIVRQQDYSSTQPIGFGLGDPANAGLLKAEKQYLHGTDFTVTSTAAATVAIIRGVASPYQTYDGAWRMRFNINLTHGSDAALNVSISGVTFKNVTNYYQSVACVNVNNNDGDSAYARYNEDTVTVSHVTAATSTGISGDVELDSKPTWAD